MKRAGGLAHSAVWANVGAGAKGNDVQPSLVDVSRLRQGAYRLLSTALRYPTNDRLAAMTEAAKVLRSYACWTESLAFDPTWSRLVRRAGNLSRAQLPELQRTHGALFEATTSRRRISLCESTYLDPSGLNTGWILAAIDKEYAAAGLSMAASQSEPADHGVVELEYLAFLCGREVQAWEHGEAVDLLGVIHRETHFLQQHPCRWFPALAAAVAARAPSSLYALATRTTWTFAAHDADFLTAVAAQIEAHLQRLA